ncbi:hemolysin family protein [Candidatus Dependentiae bacterium]|nr:hemolysin family protein [Candidatus Dependentiae bacterium]
MEPPLVEMLAFSIIGFFIALFACSLFSFLETSITAMRLFKLKELQNKIGKYHLLFETLEKNPQRVLITTLIASCLANVIVSVLGTNIIEAFFTHFSFSASVGVPVGIGIVTIAILIVGDIIPKNLGKAYGEKLLGSTLWFMNIIFKICYPLVTLLLRISDSVLYKIGGQKALEGSSEWVSSEKEIQFLIEHINEKGLMETEKTEMLQNIFELGTTPVRETMIPAGNIISVEVSTPLNEVLSIFSKHQFTRLPVYQDKPDNMIGMVHLKDIFLQLMQKTEKPLSELVRPIMFVPESVKVNQLLKEFREQHMHIAIVINEYGSITGLVTLEDLLEEIVGEISDEYESAEEKIVELKQGGWLVDASVALDELGEILRIEFETEDAITLGGFLTETLQHLPKKGERVEYKGFCFQVQKASPTRVQQVLIFAEKNEPIV